MNKFFGFIVLVDTVAVFYLLFVERKNRQYLRFKYKIGPARAKGVSFMDITLTNEQKVQVTVTPVTATGKPAAVDGAPKWTVSTGDATLDIAADGLSAFLISSDTPGNSVVVVEADADLGSGVVSVSDSINLTVEGALAANLGLKAAPPVPK